MTYCTANALGKMLHLSASRIRQLTQLGIIPKAGHGQYELEKAVQGYVLYLRGCLARQPHYTAPAYRKRPTPESKVTWIPLSLAQQIVKEQLSLIIEELGALPLHNTKAIAALRARQSVTVKTGAQPERDTQDIHNSLLLEAIDEMV